MNAQNIMSKIFVKVDKKDTISKLMNKKVDALVFDKGKFLGVVDRKKLFRLRMDASEKNFDRMFKRVQKIGFDTSVEDAAKAMLNSDSHILPIMKGEQVAGVVTAFDVIKSLPKEVKERRASEVSKARIVLFNENEEVGQVTNFLRERGLERAPLTDDNGNISGVISIVDIVKKFLINPPNRRGGFGRKRDRSSTNKEQDILKLPAKNFVRRVDPVTASPNIRLKMIIRAMNNNKVSSVILIENKKPVGIITLTDLLKLF